jgi:hypothetical protein
MALLSAYRGYGKLHLYNLAPLLNVSKLRPAFERLEADPYVPEGFRRKHIAWYEASRTPAASIDFKYLPDKDAMQTRDTAPKSHQHQSSHSQAVYPPLPPQTDAHTVHRLLRIFAHAADLPEGKQDVLLQLQRVTTAPAMPGRPSVDRWHQDGVRKVGVFCAARENVVGGLNQFRDSSCSVLQRELSPGYLAVFSDADVFHRVTEIHSADGANEGWRDVILMSF